ncbi:fungal-specific transcription factor domain-containing protein [Fusarium oxysporum Fo47]|uniref:fungal-specific transcription factor domain-containing protein n=1 Tax=Fusarium oxysporum Fo47 TaxID=660027 RepID=UPI002869A18A|nr:fungal-specific transcription factor domain-containing protein [Fusarium oxysporum Fo47]WJG36954.1 fungal-specific transcription factor domain-domain-containing protein [Fusarium oxysporum Fo47]
MNDLPGTLHSSESKDQLRPLESTIVVRTDVDQKRGRPQPGHGPVTHRTVIQGKDEHRHMEAETGSANQLVRTRHLPDLETDPLSLFGTTDPATSLYCGQSPMPWHQAGVLEMDNEGLGIIGMSPAWPAVEDFVLNLDARLSVAVGARSDSSSGPPMQQAPSSVTSSGCGDDAMPNYFYGLHFDVTFGGHFPFLNNQILAGHVRSRQASKFLISSILALTARFCPADMFQSTTDSDSEPGYERRAAARFLKAAKEQLMCLLAVPAPDVVAGLIVLSWAEFGSNSGEGGLWMFSGMAIRMAQDLGLHRSDATDLDPQAAFYDHAPLSLQGIRVPTDEQSALHQQKSRLVMFWSAFTLDVYVSLLMGRPPTIRRAEIEVPLPTADDMKPMCHIIFPAMARSMYIFSEAVELFNLNKGAEYICSLEEIENLEKKVAQCYHGLDASLIFSTDTYKKSSSDGHAGLFLMLHLYFYTFVALLSTRRYRSLIVHERSKRSAQVACQKILQTLAIAGAVDDKGYTATPFLAYSIFVAASTLLEGMALDTEGAGDFITTVDFADIDFLSQKLREISRFFHGVNATSDAIRVKRRGRGPDSGNGREDKEDAESHCVLELQDKGMINRYTIPSTTA